MAGAIEGSVDAKTGPEVCQHSQGAECTRAPSLSPVRKQDPGGNTQGRTSPVVGRARTHTHAHTQASSGRACTDVGAVTPEAPPGTGRSGGSTTQSTACRVPVPASRF